MFYRNFADELERLMTFPNAKIFLPYRPDQIFSFFYQIHRAFYYIFHFIIGGSLPTAKLRASVWQSVFTHDMHRYVNFIFDRMNIITTLISDPSGTGKELVARAIAFCNYIPFNTEKLIFEEKFRNLFMPIHLSALPQNLIESELFGHRKGSFTGALEDRPGRLETSSRYGTIFLDEIGEINQEIQVKLLRLLQERTFQRIGENKDRIFKGKIIAATNKNLYKETKNGNFRHDLYYRICADQIRTPSLKEQIDDSPGELDNLVGFISERIIGNEKAESLASEVTEWIKKKMPFDYEWPGNVRELEQCVYNILVRGKYELPKTNCEIRSFANLLEEGNLSADEALNQYCFVVYQKTGSYSEAARSLGLNWRTVKTRVENSKRPTT